MELVTSHVGADFDALASMVAARKLYPGSVAAFSGGMDRNVREFVGLFDESLDVRNATDVGPDDVHRLIVVDTQHERRLGRFRPAVERGVPVHLYDHHPPRSEASHESAMKVEVSVTRSLGATTTLILQRLLELKLDLDPFEATLFALGIYEETGSLVFSHTTAEDIEMAARLLKHGANLDVVSDYINRSLTEKQRELLHQLILNTDYHTVHGIRIAVARAEAAEYVDEIALLTHKLCDIENVGAVFALIETGNRPGTVAGVHTGGGGGKRSLSPDTGRSVFLVARSKVEAIDVAEILEPLGGGGHHRAASAVLKGAGIEVAEQRLLKALDAQIHPQARAADIMESPVRTVDLETTVEEAGRVMLRYGYSGLVVVSGDGIAGIVTRRDVDRAKHHRLHTAPVKAVMTAGAPVATPETSVLELQEMMVASKVGRVPVVRVIPSGAREHRSLVGVVTRSGLLQALYGQTATGSGLRRRTTVLRREPIRSLLEERLPGRILEQLRRIGEISDQLRLPAYVVGGFVRDALLGVANLDIDVMVENEGIEVARTLAGEWGARLVTHERFGTAVVVLPEGQKIDFATARTEFYKFPAALPEVEFSSIQEDLYRRDFTINAMAVQLNPSNFGELLDFFDGRADLEAKVVRVLHNLSFVEDPTRIIRAVRFEQRHGFQMDRQTESLISQAVDIEIFSRLTRERMRDEFILLLGEPNPISAIHRMAHLDILKHVSGGPTSHPRLRFDAGIHELLHRVREELRIFDERCRSERITRWILYFLPLLDGLGLNDVKTVSQDMKLGDRIGQVVASATLDLPQVLGRLEENPPPSVARRLLLPIPLEVALYAAAKAAKDTSRQVLRQYLYEWRDTRADITGRKLIERGMAPGPELGRALTAALEAKLDGRATTQDEQMQIALTY